MLMKTENYRVRKTGLSVFFAVMALVLSGLAFGASSKIYAAKYSSDVIIGHGAIGEHGKVYGTKPGDQSGSEVTTATWKYGGKKSWAHWIMVARAKDPEAAKKIAKAIKDACANDNIGYGKDGTQLTAEAAKVNFDLAKIKKKCNGDCFDVACVCAAAGGLSFWPEGVDENDGFKVYTTKAYCGDWKKLQPGDILITLGNRRHVSVVVSTRTNKITGADPKPKSTYKVGEKYTVLEDRRVHVGAAKAYYGKLTKDLSAKAKKLVAPNSEYAMIPAGKKVTCLEARRNWIRTAAGWIEGKDQEGTYITPASTQTSDPALTPVS